MSAIQDFERAFAEYVGARFAVACANGTVTLEIALRALGVKPGDRVATTCLTMAATSIAILNVGAVPVYCDVDPETWLMDPKPSDTADFSVPVSLYGLHTPDWMTSRRIVDDAAQTLRPHHPDNGFTSYSFQASKILALGEGGMLCTDNETLADAARSIGSLGYDLSSSNPRISKDAIKDPRAIRHVRWPAINARMADAVAEIGLAGLKHATVLKARRLTAAMRYAEVVDGCEWITPQHIPDGWRHDMWSFAVALDTPERWYQLADAMVKHGATKPFSAWRLTFDEPAFAHLDPGSDACPVARSLQPRICAFQTNSLSDAERNATALSRAIQEIGG